MISSVKVGVRIRPLLSKETSQEDILNNYDEQSVVIRDSTYTYDYVFPKDMSQLNLYNHTAAPMLKSFLEGYNVTIMAYGQTGSGKTHTMGTSDTSNEEEDAQGLIPRFVFDLYQNLEDTQTTNKEEKIEAHIKVSFLEIYGEDVYDLLTNCNDDNTASSSASSSSSSDDRVSLAIRENDQGHVFVQGLIEHEASSPEEALAFLHQGSRSRITASTNMNAGSSRSHAVFTIELTQNVHRQIKFDDEAVASSLGGSSTEILEETTTTTSSKLTFVDLAGSERIKKTGAEGQRMKEGIQINSGLFNLGQVINGLADDQRIKQGIKNTHIPYRNSKLTHLLKDALGGNSQTLFLACVSPAEMNESETYSTLSYARQARNIQNKPVRNMDRAQQEMRRLRIAARAWMNKCIAEKFTENNTENDNNTNNKEDQEQEIEGVSLGHQLPRTPQPQSKSFFVTQQNRRTSVIANDLLQRQDVLDYVQSVNEEIAQKLDGGAPSPRKVRVSISSPVPIRHVTRTVGLDGQILFSPLNQMRRLVNRTGKNDKNGKSNRNNKSAPWRKRTASTEEALAALAASINASSDGKHQMATPEETERLVSRMLELVEEEKEKKSRKGKEITKGSKNDTDITELQVKRTSDNHNDDDDEGESNHNSENESDQEVDDENDIDADIDADEESDVHSIRSQQSQEVDKEIEEKEAILRTLLETVKDYSAMRADYERLLNAIGSLESERKQLEMQLSRAQKAGESAKSKQQSANAARQVERIKDRFAKVKDELDRMKTERKTKESAYRSAQRESRKCDELNKELQRLKDVKTSLMRTNKQSALKHAKAVKEFNSKVAQISKQTVKKQRQLNSIKTELTKKERILTHRDKEISRLQAKLKACEEHISQLLKVQTSKRLKNNGHDSHHQNHGDQEVDEKTVKSAKKVLDTLVQEMVAYDHTRTLLSVKTEDLAAIHADLAKETAEIARLQEMRVDAQASVDKHREEREQTQAPSDTPVMSSTEAEALHRLEELDHDLHVTEDVVHELTSEMDAVTAEANELRNRASSQSCNLPLNEDGSCLGIDEVGLNIISSLNSNQAQDLCRQLLIDKAEALTKLALSKDQVKACKAAEDGAIARETAAIAAMNAERESTNKRIADVERSRMHEVWCLIKAKEHQEQLAVTGVTNEDDDNSNTTTLVESDEIILKTAQNTSLQVAMTKISELEADINDKTVQLSDMQSSLDESIAKQQTLEFAHADADARARLAIVDAAATTAAHKKLTEVWDNLGHVTVAQRKAVIKSIEEASTTASQQALKDAHACFEEHRSEEKSLRRLCSIAAELMGSEQYVHLQMLAGRPSDSDDEQEQEMDVYSSRNEPDVISVEVTGDSQQVVSNLEEYSEADKQNNNYYCSSFRERGTVRDRLCDLKESSHGALTNFYRKLAIFMDCRSRLLNLCNEMELEVSEETMHHSLCTMYATKIPSEFIEIQGIGKVSPDFDTISKASVHLVLSVSDTLVNSGVSLSDDVISTMQGHIKQLNIQRATTVSNCVAETSACRQLLQELFNATSCDELKGHLSCLALGDDLPEQSMITAVQLVSDVNANSPPGSGLLLMALERLRLALETVRMNRVTISGLLDSFTLAVNSAQDIISTENQDKEKANNIDNNADTNSTCMKVDIDSLELAFEKANDACMNAEASSNALNEMLVRTIKECCAADVLPNNLDNKIHDIVKAARERALQADTQPINMDMSGDFTDKIMSGSIKDQDVNADDIYYRKACASLDEMQSMSLFIDEEWLCDRMQGLRETWDDTAIDIHRSAVLKSLVQQCTALSDAVKELYRLDTQLVKHCIEMEEFEVQSKANRGKVLTGSSKALMEEERFRKTGKRKYEVLTDKMLQSMELVSLLTASLEDYENDEKVNEEQEGQHQLQQKIHYDDSNRKLLVGLMGFASRASAESVALKLSHQGRQLLRGNRDDRIELMHLHTTTHGTKRWDVNDSDGHSSTNNNQIPVSSTDNNISTVKNANTANTTANTTTSGTSHKSNLRVPVRRPLESRNRDNSANSRVGSANVSGAAKRVAKAPSSASTANMMRTAREKKSTSDKISNKGKNNSQLLGPKRGTNSTTNNTRTTTTTETEKSSKEKSGKEKAATTVNPFSDVTDENFISF